MKVVTIYNSRVKKLGFLGAAAPQTRRVQGARAPVTLCSLGASPSTRPAPCRLPPQKTTDPPLLSQRP